MSNEVTALAGLAAVPVHLLRSSPANPRERLRDIEDLAASIAAEGLIEPIVVQRIPAEDGYQIVAGHRRAAAVRHLGIPRVLCLITKDLLPDNELARMLIENGQRVNLDPIEEANALRQLAAMTGLSRKALGARIGRSDAYVSTRLQLLRLNPADQTRVRSGDLSVADGIQRARRVIHGGTPAASDRGWHFSSAHPLAAAVAGRCSQFKHPRKLAKTGCGECWEHIIRTDALREHDCGETATVDEISACPNDCGAHCAPGGPE